MPMSISEWSGEDISLLLRELRGGEHLALELKSLNFEDTDNLFDWFISIQIEDELIDESWVVLEEYHMPLSFVSERGKLLLLFEEREDSENDDWLLIVNPDINQIVSYLKGEIPLKKVLENELTEVYLINWDVNKDLLTQIRKFSKQELWELLDDVYLEELFYTEDKEKIERILRYFTSASVGVRDSYNIQKEKEISIDLRIILESQFMLDKADNDGLAA